MERAKVGHLTICYSPESHGIDTLNNYQSIWLLKTNFQIFSFFDAFTLVCPLPIHNIESVSKVSLCLHFLLTGCHAGHVIIRGIYHDQ